MNWFFRNAKETSYTYPRRKGSLESVFGILPFHEGDYMIVPRGTTYRIL